MAAAPVVVGCIPNVSEGRDPAVIARLAGAVRDSGALLMDVHSDPDHHRSVFSFLGGPGVVEAAVLALARTALETIDMRRHQGAHPRIGALDVVPIVPLRGCSLADAVVLAHRVGARIAERHHVPVYFYGEAARRDHRRRLPDARRGGYEALAERLTTPEGVPDEGPARFDPRAGAVLVGARDILVAFNVWLDSSDLEAARQIARVVRESSGGLPGVQALGLALPSRGLVQVSMNLLDYRRTPIPVAFDAVLREAARRGIGVRRGELVGVAPAAALAGRAPESVGLQDFTSDRRLETWLAKV